MTAPRAIVLALGLVAAAAPAAGAPDGFKNAGPGNFGSGVRYITHVPGANDTSGGRILGQHFYLTTARDLRIYDIAKPKSPVLLGLVAIPQTPYFSEEDLDTNGRIALVENSVVDVTDKANPTVIGTLGLNPHTWTCVLDCSYGYADSGQIFDLRNPAAPVNTGKRWTTGTGVSGSHDVTEVAPGLVVTSSDPVLYLDARQDPTQPAVLAQTIKRNRFAHGNLWPNQGTDDFLLVGGETQGPACTGASAQFVTMDATTWEEDGTFRQIDEYRVSQGLPTQGQSPANQWCTHWFDEHPDFHDGGLVAMAWYEHGTRFLDVSSTGKITEVGWFIPAGGSTSAVYWATDSVVYSIDYNRGFDIIEWMGPGWKGSKLP